MIPAAGRVTDHLANERTFLAWLRTAITLLGLGFVVARFGLWLREMSVLQPQAGRLAGSGLSLPIGVGILGLAAFTAILGTARYHTVRRAIERGEFSPSHWTITAVAALIVALAAVLIGYLLTSSFRF
jgi:putative membrane protein